MPTLVTIKNIGRTTELIDGNSVAPGATLVVDLDDEQVRSELRTDFDYVVLPDSAAGTGGGGGEAVAFDHSDYAAQFALGDFWTVFPNLEITVTDDPTNYRRIELFIPIFNGDYSDPPLAAPKIWLYGLEVNGSVTRNVYRHNYANSVREAVHLTGILRPNLGIDSVIKPVFRVREWVGASGNIIIGGLGLGMDESHLMATIIGPEPV